MLIITIRTDRPEAELGLYDGTQRLAYETWIAHRQLAETIHLKLKTLIESQQKNLQDIEGIVVFRGPGSFTGLRIGLTVANTLAYALNIPIVGTGELNWLEAGVVELQNGHGTGIALPEYGAAPHITAPKH
jgi:tRNA threonylcarbamoyladenosine biosynthesis protein TsaB